MIERYTLPEIEQVWSQENRFRKMLEIEIFACEKMSQMGLIPSEALNEITAKADFDIERIKEIEKETKHDVIAFLTNVAENVGPASKYIHMGMTSSDVLDTSLALQMKEASQLILQKLYSLYEALALKALEHKETLMVGRTHGVHAEPITFGLKLALWLEEVERAVSRMKSAQEEISVGSISGAVGTYAAVSPEVEEYVCEKLELTPAMVSNQIIQRDRHAFFMNTLAVTASSLEKFALEIRNLQRTDILEVEEGFASGQKGSSAMPHKKNPIVSERICGLARVVRGNALAAMENIALWHERDLTHSSVERIIIPDSTILLYYMITQFSDVIKTLVVNKINMERNLNSTLGLIFSQSVMLALIDKGIAREEAYSLVQKNAMKCWELGIPFKDLLIDDENIMLYFNEEEFNNLFKYSCFLENIDYIYNRLQIAPEKYYKK